MKKAIVTVIAGLIATAAFAQTPAPAASTTSKPGAMLVNNADLKASKADTKTVHANAPAAQASANATHEDAKPAPMPTHARHAKSKPKHVAKADTMKNHQDTTAATPAPAAPLGQDAAPAPTPVDTPAPAPAAATTPAPDAAPAPAATPAPAAPVTQ